jgi:predicted RNA-binding Zn-ribbon protein involved in translation (DUF1610 family)
LSSKLCPECGASTHRSHARGLKEKLIRTFSFYKTYRCHECGWRGWFGKSHTNTTARKNRLRTIISLLITLLITLLLALYLIDKMTTPPAPDQMQQTTP